MGKPAGKHVFITGSSDGIGLETARRLIGLGHRVVLHARDDARAEQARAAAPGAAGVLVGDLTSVDATRELAEAATRAAAVAGPEGGQGAGGFDAVVHNAGVGGGATAATVTGDGLERLFQINTVAPYLLTALMPRPGRLVYLTSGLEAAGRVDFDDLQYLHRPWDGMQAYSDSKLYDVVLAFAVARRWPGTPSNAVDPGWVRTKLGGPDATDGLAEGAGTQVWLVDSGEPAAVATGRYLKHRRVLEANPAASDPAVQERLLAELAALTGVKLD